MPTPRSHGGAQLEKLPLNLPGFKGLNTQIDGALLGTEWATVLRNTVIDKGNRVAARKGWLRRSREENGPGVYDLVQMFEYQTHSGAYELVVTNTFNELWASDNDGITWRNVTGSATVTDPNMQFVNFKDQVFGWQDGGEIVVYAGELFSDFHPTVGDKQRPLGGVALSAFGRLWAADIGGTFLQYSALLNENDWHYPDPTSDSGGFELKNVWQGTDTIQALSEFNGSLVVFGEKNILVWSDGEGSDVGLDPLNMYVVDTIPKLGCIARDSVQNVDGDLWFLSDSGVMSLTRLIQEKSNPIQNLSYNVQGDILKRGEATNKKAIRSVYSPDERFYLLSFPSGGFCNEQGEVYCFDTRGTLEDGSARCIGVWDGLVPRAMVHNHQKDIVIYITSSNAVIGVYQGYKDLDGCCAPFVPPTPVPTCKEYECESLSDYLTSQAPKFHYIWDQGGVTPSAGVNDIVRADGLEDWPVTIQNAWANNNPTTDISTIEGADFCGGTMWTSDQGAPAFFYGASSPRPSLDPGVITSQARSRHLTIGMWVYGNSDDTTIAGIEWQDATGAAQVVPQAYVNSGNAFVKFWDSGASWDLATYLTTEELTQFNYWVFTCEDMGNSLGETYKWYVNGLQRGPDIFIANANARFVDLYYHITISGDITSTSYYKDIFFDDTLWTGEQIAGIVDALAQNQIGYIDPNPNCIPP
jgi:hypothetical protein